MSATLVCETSTSALHSSHIHEQHTVGPQRPGRYRWPSFSSLRGGSSSSKSRSSSLRVVSSETTPTPAQKPAPSSPAAPVRASSDRPSLDSSAADVAEAVREQARLPEPAVSAAACSAEQQPSSPAPRTAKTHVRAKSTTAAGEPSLHRLDFPSARTTPRARASSSATMATQPRVHPRPRLPSMLASVLTSPRAPAHIRMASTAESELVGSFAPTSSPRERLLSLLHPGSIVPSPTPTAPPSPRRATLRLSTDHVQRANAASHERRRRTASSPIDSPSSPLPSICRTPSSYSGSEYFPTAPSSAGPATPVHVAAALPPSARKGETLHPVLEGLERASVFAVQTACATCGRGGSNFPCCPRCGEMWCSRPCRLQKGNGKRHICSRRA